MFGYKCEECRTGTVREAVRSDYQVKFDRIPFAVPEATIGVCDHCGAENFSSQEYRRWRALFDEAQRSKQAVISPSDIRQVREDLGMTATGFAALIGVARQTLHYWEDEERTKNPSRSAELMLRLVREAVRCASVRVVDFLWRQAEVDGIEIPSCLPEVCASDETPMSAALSDYDALYKDVQSRTPISPCLRIIASPSGDKKAA